MQDTPRFRPFETDLDPGRALAVLRDATAGADDGELFLERRRAESLHFDDGRLKTASYDAAEGFGLRAVRGETAGYAHSTEISEAALKRAAETARLQKAADRAGKDAGGLRGRLSNPRFVESAEPEVIDETREKLAALEEEIARARAALDQLARL